MKLAIMQPYFFPYLGYFDLINRVDSFVVFDNIKYSNKSWMNRNRILHPDKKNWLYISIPVKKNSLSNKICDLYPSNIIKVEEKIMGQIDHYRLNKAPFFIEVKNILNNFFSSIDGLNLAEINTRSIELVCNYLNIEFNYSYLSKTDFQSIKIDHPGEWALNISEYFQASEYINLPNGEKLFNLAEWKEKNITISFTDLINFKYECADYTFHDHLSIIDVLMWSEPDKVTNYLDHLNF